MAQGDGLRQIVFANVREMPPLAVSLADTRYNKTGSWRRLRPVHGEFGSPCDAACPNGNAVRQMLGLVAGGQVDEALAVLHRTSALPGVCGRVCYHPCEESCNRAQFDAPLAVQAVERFAADHGTPPPTSITRPSGRSIAVIGGGPAGLSCAYHLSRLGHRVVLFEARGQLGGLLRYGIPGYRLPRAVLDREIDLLLREGIEVRTGQRFGKDFGLEDLKAFDAVFLGAGAQRSRRLSLPGEDCPGVLSGLELLRRVAEGQQPEPGRRVVVVGGGNTAVDSARVARRLGAEVAVVYRRTKGDMPAIPEEVAAAEDEGIAWRFQAAPTRLVALEGRLAGVAFAPTRPGGPGGDGRPRVEIDGPEFQMQADSVIVAIGEDVERSLLPEEATISGQWVTWPRGDGHPIWRVGGDFAGTRRRVADAMGDGQRAALAIDRRLRGLPAPVLEPEPVVRYERLNTEYFWPQTRAKLPVAPPRERAAGFQEVVGGHSQAEAAREAARCFSCGRCTQCDNCWLFCPDVAVQRDPGGYRIDYDYCKGCGICAAECPRSAIAMREEVGG